MKHTILCVDDEIDNLDALERLFRAKYSVLRAASGAEALKILDQNPENLSVLITDQRMPQMTGVQLLEKSLETHPDLVRILLTGYTDIESIIEAVNSGQIYRYINKPWDPVDLISTVDRAVEKYLMTKELKQKNKELSTAFAELKTLDDAKNRFMILINHELKTPLTSIINFTDLIKETKLSEEQEVCVKRIEKGTNRLRSVIDDVLLIVQAETATLKTKIGQFECTDLQIQVSPEALALATQKGLKTVLRWLPKKIIADQLLIQQVLNRLIHNSIKFADDNSQILVRTDLAQPHRIRFSVYNKGSRISPAVIDKIMKPFFLDEDVMNHSGGMGLGLTICQSILKAHSARLDVKNENEGVEVAFDLPCL
jgi:two-component system, sensor histidine kinase and response regulator